MHRLSRILLVVAVLLCGAAIAPSLALPSQSFNWQQYASAYQQPEPVAIRDFAFAPNVIIIPVGTTVRWTNGSAVNDHTVTSNTGLFDSGTLDPGVSFEYRFDAPGTYPYYCALHSGMTGKVIVSNQVFDLYLPLIRKNAP
jgi:plastocyanin